MNGFSAPRPIPSRSTRTRRLAAAALVAAAAVAAGCVGYSTWPPQEGSNVPSNPNFNEMRLAMTTALEWTVDRYPPGPIDQPDHDTPVAINLPDGVRSSMYRIIVENVADRAQPMRPDNTHLPIYHITGVTVTGDDGTVNIARPVSGWGTDNPLYQGVTLKLRGGMFREWRVIRHHAWTPGAMQPPELHFIPDSMPDQEGQQPAQEDAAQEAPPPATESEAAASPPVAPPAAQEPAPAPAPAPAPEPKSPPPAEEHPAAADPAPAPTGDAPTWD